METKRNQLLELFGAVIADRQITMEEFLAVREWFAASPPLKKEEALFCLKAVSQAVVKALREKRLEMDGHEAVAFTSLLWQTAWEQFYPARRTPKHRVIFQDRWRPMQKMVDGADRTLDIAVFNFGEDRLSRRLQAKAMAG